MKKLLPVIILLTFWLGDSSCKRIWRYPINMYGLWTSEHNNCSWMLLEIKKNGAGTYGPGNCCKGCDAHIKGQVRFTKEHLFVGIARLKFLSKPEIIDNDDSLYLSYPHKMSRILAKMTIQETHLRGGGTYTFYKIADY